MPAPQRLAVDTNVLIDLAEGEETVVDCLETCRERLNVEAVVVVPTVLHELAFIAQSGDKSASRSAINALRSLLDPWGFSPMNCIPVGHGIVEETARKILAAGLLPEEERNDAFVVAEAGLLDASLLITSDRHLRGVEHERLKVLLDRCDISTPLIVSPWRIVNGFLR